MKIEYPILWIDDNRDYFETLKHDVIDHIQSHGMVEEILFALPASLVDVADLVRKHNPYLVVIDYKLGNGLTGDKLIEHIRDARLYHEILFYSQEGFDEETFKSFFSSVDSPLATGVNFCPKGEAAIDKICNLIDLKLSQVADLSTQRGWIVADVIELEHKLYEVLNLLGGSTHQVFSGTLKRLINSDRIDFGYLHEILNGAIKDLIAYLQVDDKEPAKLKTLKSAKAILNEFRNEVIELRNSIAHQAHSIDEKDGCILIPQRQRGLEPMRWEPDLIKGIRINLKKHNDNLDELCGLLSTG